MTVLLRRRTDGSFLKSSTEWTTSANAARDFEQTINALAFVLNNSLDRAEIVLHFPSTPAHDLCLRVY